VGGLPIFPPKKHAGEIREVAKRRGESPSKPRMGEA
jgi:hypothetical protein